MSTLIRTDEVPAADRLDYVQQITAATWVPMECRAERSGDYWGVFRASGLGPMQVVAMDIMPITVRRTPAFRAAGLPAPNLLIEAFAEGGPDAPAWAWANVISAAVPLMERFRVATRAEVDPPTLAKRLLTETLDRDGYVIGPPMTGAWATVPAV